MSRSPRARRAASYAVFATGVVVPPLLAPVNVSLPVITGTAQEGQTLSVSNGIWSNSPTAFAFQWRRDGVPIAGSTFASRLLVAADIGASMSVTVTASNAAGSAAATSAGTAAIVAAPVAVPVNSVAPAITGTGAIGQTLTSTTGTWSGSPTGYTYEWRRNGVNIAGATASTYLLVTADGGAAITCRVTATNAGGSAGATSNAIAVAAGSSAVYLPAFASSYSAARGTQTMVSGYTGPLFRLRRGNAGSATYQDFSAGSNGLPSDAEINAFANGQPVYPFRAYDQTGNGLHIEWPIAAGSVLALDLTMKLPNGALFFGLSLASPGARATGHAIDMQNFTHFAVAQQPVGPTSNIWSVDDGTSTLDSWLAIQGWLRSRSLGGGYVSYGAQGVQVLRANPVVIGQTNTSANRRLYLAETSRTAAAAAGGTATAMAYGVSKNPVDGGSARWAGDALVSAALSDGDAIILRDRLATMFGVAQSFDRRFVMIGDSIRTLGNANTRSAWEYATFAGSCEVINLAIAGRQMADQQTTSGTFLPFITSAYGAGRCVVELQSGTNDLSPTLGNKTAAQLLATANTFIGQFRSTYAGVRVLWSQLLPRTDVGTTWTSAAESERVSYNASVLANGGSNPADLIFRQGDTGSTMGALAAPDSTTLYKDKLHPTELGMSYVAVGQPTPPAGPASLGAAVNALWS